MVRGEPAVIRQDSAGEPGLRLLQGGLHRAERGRPLLQPRQPNGPRLRRHEPLLPSQGGLDLFMLLLQVRPHRRHRPKLCNLPLRIEGPEAETPYYVELHGVRVVTCYMVWRLWLVENGKWNKSITPVII